MIDRDEMARIVARDIPDGAYVNLGIGLHTKVADHLHLHGGVVLLTENEKLGMGPLATDDDGDPDLRNPDKQPRSE